MRVLHALHGPELRSDVRDDSKLPHVPQDVKLPPDQEMGNAPLVPPEVMELHALYGPDLRRVVRKDVKLPVAIDNGQLPSSATSRKVRTL